jgi:excisionase family DNA binding protein
MTPRKGSVEDVSTASPRIGARTGDASAADASTSLDPLLTVDDVARILRISRASVYTLVASGDLRPVRLPLRKTRFRRSDVEDLIS